MLSQTVKNPPAIQETWVRSLGWEDPLEEGTATHSCLECSCLENPMNKGAWWATVDGVAKSWNTTEQLTLPHFHSGSPGKKLGSQVSWGQVMLPLGFEARHHQHFFLLFSVGPLHSDLEYTVSSQKEGYVLTAVEGTIGDFKAYALAGVSFEVTPCAFKKQFYGV